MNRTAYLRKHHSIAIGERSAERIKIELGSAYPVADEATSEVSGRDLTTGLPRRVEVSGKEIREAAEAQVAEIIDAVRKTLDACPPELAGDIMNTGIVLMGGGSLLKGLEERLRQEVQMPVEVAKDPLTCVVRGAGACLQDFDSMKAVLVGDTARYHSAKRRYRR